MRRLAYVFLALFLLLSFGSKAQEKYWIYFNSKTGNSIDVSADSVRAHRDLPIHQAFIDDLKVFEVEPIVRSKWLNAITAYIDSTQLKEIENLPFVSSVQPTRKIASLAAYDEPEEYIESYSSSLNHVNAKALVDYGFTGEGVEIGIIDGGFMQANESVELEDIFYEDQFKEFMDFTGENRAPFEGQKMYNEDHGTRVWRNIGGYDREKDRFFGIATYSNYYLAKADKGEVEYRGEEDYWVAALEWMDSKGIKIVNSSMGFSTGFDDPTEDYSPEDIDGVSSPITQAAQIAAEEKGILVVVSAGNEGNADFQVVSVPADAQDVLTVGACSSSTGKKLSYSSIGPSLSYTKPDVCVFSLGGTSFSAPVITGIAAGILQHNPNYTNKDIIEILQKSAHLYPYANNYVGYGVPDGEKILKLMADRSAVVWDAEEKEVVGDLVSFEAGSEKKLTVFHKKSGFIVFKEEELTVDEGEFIIARPAGVARSTLSIRGKVWEIIWQ